jgi:hypothetical protein
MSAPIVFISQNRVIEGKLDSLKEYYRQVAEMTEANGVLEMMRQAAGPGVALVLKPQSVGGYIRM